MSFLWNNFAAIYVAVFASALAWLFGGMRGDILAPVMPWLLAILVEVVLFFPQRNRGEASYDARRRVWRAMKKDPLVLVSVGLLVLLAVPFVNRGLCPLCDAKAIADGLSPEPPVKFLPFCLDWADHLNVYYWFAGALLSVIAVRHSLKSKGKRLVIEMIVWNGVLLALLGFVQEAAGAVGPYWQPKVGRVWGDSFFFSTFAYPNMAGDYFTTLFCLAAALWRWRHDEVRKDFIEDHEHAEKKRRGIFWRGNYHLIPVALFFFAALNTLSRASIMLVTAGAVLFFLHTFVSFLARLPRATRVKSGTWSLMILGLIAFSAATFSPDNLQREVGTIETTGVLDRLTGKTENHVQVATAIWKDHLMFGCGGWGFKHLSPVKGQQLGLKYEPGSGGANVHNDLLQFLTEHGFVGFAALLAIVALLIAPVGRTWKIMMATLRFTKPKEQPPKPVKLFIIPAPVFFILTGCVLTLIHSFADCPLRSAAVLVLFFVSLATLEGFLPKLEMPEMPKEDHHHHHHHHHHHSEEK